MNMTEARDALLDAVAAGPVPACPHVDDEVLGLLGGYWSPRHPERGVRCRECYFRDDVPSHRDVSTCDECGDSLDAPPEVASRIPMHCPVTLERIALSYEHVGGAVMVSDRREAKFRGIAPTVNVAGVIFCVACAAVADAAY
jgi:hypothetical protein